MAGDMTLLLHEGKGGGTDAVDAEVFFVRSGMLKSSHYLILGTLCGLFGGGYSTYITYAHYTETGRTLNMQGEPFPSGHVYWPPSVSNMVDDIQSAQGKVWLAFMVTSAFMMMISYYPYVLHNVYIGEDVPFLPFMKTQGLSMMTARTFLPSLGLLMVALVHTTAPNVFDPAQASTLFIHTGGAILWLGVQIYVEAYTLCSGRINIGQCEKTLRWLCVAGALVGAAVYLLTSSLPAESVGLCCTDEYRPVTMADVKLAASHGAYLVAAQDKELMQFANFSPGAAVPLYQGLYNTAYGQALAWKLVEFWSEAFTGFCMLVDLVVIWRFSSEREAGRTLPSHLPVAP